MPSLPETSVSAKGLIEMGFRRLDRISYLADAGGPRRILIRLRADGAEAWLETLASAVLVGPVGNLDQVRKLVEIALA